MVIPIPDHLQHRSCCINPAPYPLLYKPLSSFGSYIRQGLEYRYMKLDTSFKQVARPMLRRHHDVYRSVAHRDRLRVSLDTLTI